MLKAYSKICTCIYRAVITVSIAFMVIMIIASSLQVFSRYVLNNTFSWTDECARYCFVWFNLLGAGCLVRTKGHAVVDLFSQKLGGGARKIYGILINLFILYMGLVLIKYGSALCSTTMRQRTTALKLPMGLVYGALPVLGVLILIYQIEAVWKLAVQSKTNEGEEVSE